MLLSNPEINLNLNINSSYLNELLQTETDKSTQNLNILIEMDKITLNNVESHRKLLNNYKIENEQDLKVNMNYILCFFFFNFSIINFYCKDGNSKI